MPSGLFLFLKYDTVGIIITAESASDKGLFDMYILGTLVNQRTHGVHIGHKKITVLA